LPHIKRQSRSPKRHHIYPPVFGTWLSDAYDARTTAHYKRATLSVKFVRRLVDHVREFVTKVEEATKT
jgi:hypothetical protein